MLDFTEKKIGICKEIFWIFYEDFWENFVIFDQVRLKPYFIRDERCFEGIFDDFWRCWNGEKHWFFKVLSNSVSNSKWGSRCGNIRYALPGNRTFVLKCKLSPLPGVKTYYNSTVLWYLFGWSVVWAAIADLLQLIQTVIL